MDYCSFYDDSIINASFSLIGLFVLANLLSSFLLEDMLEMTKTHYGAMDKIYLFWLDVRTSQYLFDPVQFYFSRLWRTRVVRFGTRISSIYKSEQTICEYGFIDGAEDEVTEARRDDQHKILK